MSDSPGGCEPAVASPLESLLDGSIPPLPVAGAVAGPEELRTVQQMVLIERWLQALRTWTARDGAGPEKLHEHGPHGRP